METMTVGADPELMVANAATGQLVSAIPLLSGTKKAPKSYSYGVTMHDNVNAEFAIKPSMDKKEFVHFIFNMLKCLKEEVGSSYKLLALPSAIFPESELTDKEARTFGCDPDYNGWTWVVKQNDIPVGANTAPFRTCGGHIHIGHPAILKSGFSVIRMVKLMDFFVGIPSAYMDCLADAKARRNLYGKAGCFRLKQEYGIEYRAASNFWIGSPELSEIIYELTGVALKALINDTTPAFTVTNRKKKPVDPEVFKDVNAEMVQHIINESNNELAKEVLENVLVKYIGEPLLDRILKNSGKASLRNIEPNWNI